MSPLQIGLLCAIFLILQIWGYGALHDRVRDRKIRDRLGATQFITMVATIVTSVVQFVRAVV